MPVTVDLLLEESEDIGIVDGRAELPLVCLGTTSALAARNAVREYLANVGVEKNYHGLSLMNVQLKREGPDIFKGAAQYNTLIDKIKFNYSCMAEKVRKSACVEEIGNFQVFDPSFNGWRGPSFDRLVNVSKDRIEGVDVYDAHSAAKLTMQWSAKFQDIRADYIGTVEDMRATVNDSPIILTYRGQTLAFQRGEVLLIGGDFEETKSDGCSINLAFEVNRNNSRIVLGDVDGTGSETDTTTGNTASGSATITNIPITSWLVAGMTVSGTGIPAGAVITSIVSGTSITISEPATATGTGVTLTFTLKYLSKEGHHYGWIRTTKVDDETLGIKVDRPSSFHTGRFYEYADFTRLEVFDRIQEFDDDLNEQNEEWIEEVEGEWIPGWA